MDIVYLDQENVENYAEYLTWDEEATELLFENYESSIMDDEVVKSTFSLPAMTSAREKAALSDRGFTVELMEDDIIRSRLSEAASLPPLRR